MDFIILSLPRSGSHMLASALDSHPDVQCSGEYDMVEKFPLGRTKKPVRGCIVQAYHIERRIAPPSITESTKVIALFRPVWQIADSLHRGNPSGRNFSQHLEPTEAPKDHPPLDQTLFRIQGLRATMDRYLEDRTYVLGVSYRGLCGEKDARAIRWEQAHRICDFLEVVRHPLIPLTHKPYKKS